MANYMVTGGAGFIGSQLTDKLIELGHHVIIVDNLSNGQRIHPMRCVLNEILLT